MDRMRGLDAYITGRNIHFEDDAVPHRCPKCGLERKIPMFYELGGWFYPPEFEDLSYCEKCNIEMNIIKDGE